MWEPVQELADRRSLADMVSSGWRAEEGEVERIAAEALAILQYLGSLRPPVIHRCPTAAVPRVWPVSHSGATQSAVYADLALNGQAVGMLSQLAHTSPRRMQGHKA
jgi:hypothetical protein